MVPLPPYIKRPVGPSDRQDVTNYQTVYAEHIGSVAAPTAGLHFTPRLLESFQRKNIQTKSVILHVGPGTFLPVRSQIPSEHRMHAEPFFVPTDTLRAILEARKQGKPVVVVGTTVFRSLEALALKAKKLGCGMLELCDRWQETDLFIYPKASNQIYKPWAANAIVTNFHQPYSTLFMLIASLIGLDEAKLLYGEAVQKKLRFHSYGDGSLLWL